MIPHKPLPSALGLWSKVWYLCTQISTTSFTIASDVTSEFAPGISVKVDAGGTVGTSHVSTSSYSGGVTTVTLEDPIVSSSTVSATYSVFDSSNSALSADFLDVNVINSNGSLRVTNSLPKLRLRNTAATTDQKEYQLAVQTNGDLTLSAVSDNLTTVNNVLDVTRTGAVVDQLNLYPMLQMYDKLLLNTGAGLGVNFNTVTGGTTVPAGITAELRLDSPRGGTTADLELIVSGANNYITLGVDSLTNLKAKVGSNYYQILTSGNYDNWKIVNANYQAVLGDRLLTDSSGGSFTITLPDPTAGTGSRVDVVDAMSMWGTNSIKVQTSNAVSYPMMGATTMTVNGNLVDENYMTMDVTNGGVAFVYMNSTRGWVVAHR